MGDKKVATSVGGALHRTIRLKMEVKEKSPFLFIHHKILYIWSDMAIISDFVKTNVKTRSRTGKKHLEQQYQLPGGLSAHYELLGRGVPRI
jgi:hypothetical protein